LAQAKIIGINPLPKPCKENCMSQIKSDLENISPLANAVTKWCCDFQQQLPQMPVAVLGNPQPEKAELQQQGLGAERAFAQFIQQIAPGLSGSAGPRYLGFVTGGVTPAAMLADWIVAAIDQNVMVPGDSISSAVEQQTIEWLLELFSLPAELTGTLTSGATSANILGLLCARQYCGDQQGMDIARDGIGSAKIEVFSACPHASSKKAMAFTGMGRDSIIDVPTLAGSEAMDTVALENLLAASKSPGKIVIASAGTVTGTNFDDLQQIAQLCRQYQAWLHVDAAFGLFSRLITERLPLTAGIEHADSITCDGHKWLNVPYDCGIFFTKHPEILQQACSVSAPYLDVSINLPAYMDRGIENSRRFRAMPVWLTLQAYGRDGYKEIVANNCNQATALARWIEQSNDYQLLTPCRLNVVVFSPKNQQRSVKELLNTLNQSGQVYLTPGMWDGQQAIRAAFSNWRTSIEDVEIVCELLSQKVAG